MRSVSGALVAMLLTSPLPLQAGQATLGTCAASVGAWEFIEDLIWAVISGREFLFNH